MKRKFIAALTAALALWSANVLAVDAATASSKATFQFTLVDLTPDDGITPWITLKNGSNSGGAHVCICDFYGGDTYQDGSPPAPTFPGPRNGVLTVGETVIKYDISGSATAFVMSTSTISATDKALASGNVSTDTDFVLSPNTELLVSGTFEQAVHSSQEYTVVAYASTYVRFDEAPYSAGTAYTTIFGGAYRPDSDIDFSRSFDVPLFNTTDHELKGNFLGSVASSTLAIDAPEANSGLMLAAGLLLLAGVRSRRARSRCPSATPTERRATGA